MFYIARMSQLAFSFGRQEQLTVVRDRLKVAFPATKRWRVLSPMAQLVKSIISSRTKDTVSWPVFFRLIERYPSWSALKDAPVEAVEAMIADVTFAKDKAAYVLQTLRRVEAASPQYDLGFLEAMPMEQALQWLRKLPGVGPKVAASVMNFSSLGRASFVVDGHVLRVLQRLGLVASTADTERAYRRVMELLPDWDSEALVELHVLLKHLGQEVCSQPDPQCEICPVRRDCHRQFH